MCVSMYIYIYIYIYANICLMHCKILEPNPNLDSLFCSHETTYLQAWGWSPDLPACTFESITPYINH